MSSLVNEKAISQVVLLDMARMNRLLVDRAIKQWDIDGQGCFACYIQDQVIKSWCRLVVLN